MESPRGFVSKRCQWDQEIGERQKLALACRKANEQGICHADCCGPVPILKQTYLKHIDKIDPERIKSSIPSEDCVYVLTKDIKCIFLKDSKCLIYEDRPQLCKDFGVLNNPLMMCPYLKPNGNPWSPAKQKQLRRITNKMINQSMDKMRQGSK